MDITDKTKQRLTSRNIDRPKKASRAKVACLVKKKPFPSMRGATEHHHQGQSLQNGEIKIKRYRNYALEYFERFLEQGDSKRLARRMLWLCVE